MISGPLLLLSLLPLHADQGSSRDPSPPANASAMVKYLNDNARRIRSLTFTNVSMRVGYYGTITTAEGRLDCQRPRSFRLTGKFFGQPVVDLGSNPKEFWYSKADPYHVEHHYSYSDLPEPDFKPYPYPHDMILAVLGMLEHDPNKSYEVRSKPDTTELIESIRSVNGLPLQKITIFRNGQTSPDEPKVIGHIFRDTKGKDICKATITHSRTDPKTGAARAQPNDSAARICRTDYRSIWPGINRPKQREH